MNIEPNLGVRIKLATRGPCWEAAAKVQIRAGRGRADEAARPAGAGQARRTAQAVRFHLGSQITDIRFVKAGLEEIGRYYVEIREMGFDLTHVDVGGLGGLRRLRTTARPA